MPILTSVAAACARAYGFTSGLTPFVYTAPVPNLFLDFASTTTLDSRITFTRATNGTFFNSSGVLSTASSGVARFDHRLEGGVWVNKGLLIEEQRTNLHIRSEEIDNAAYTKTNTTVTADATTAPDGNTTADAVFETTTTGAHSVRTTTNLTVDSTTNYAFSIFAKGIGRSVLSLQMLSTGGSITAEFDLSAVTATTLAPSGTGVVLGATIEDVGNGWYRCALLGRTGVTNANFWTYIQDASGNYFYTGDVTKGMYVWGYTVEAGAFPTSYIKTTTASVTRNADVASMTGTNFSSWYNSTEGTVFWQGDTTATGLARGWYITDNTVNERLVWSAAFNGNTSSFFVGDGGVTQANLSSPDPAVAIVQNKTYKSASAYKANDFGHSLDGNSTNTDTSGSLPTVNKINLGADFSGASDFLNGHIAKFAYWPTRLSNDALQSLSANGYDNVGLSLILNLDQTTVLDPRITFTRATNGTFFNSSGVLSTASSGVARFDHRLEGGVWVNKGLLIEEQRANICLRSEDFSTTWANTNTTETVNTTAAPSGATTADSIFETTTNGAHVIYQAITVDMISTTYTGSVFVKANGRTRGDIQVLSLGTGNPNFLSAFDLTAGTITAAAGSGTPISQSIEDVGNGWYRVSISGYTGQSGSHRLQIGIRNDSNQASYTGDTSKGLILWGAQLEAGAFPTSYIATTTASVTRNGDVAEMTSTDFSSWYNQSEGTIFCQAQYEGLEVSTSNARFWEISNGGTSERHFLTSGSTLTPAGAFRYGVIDGGVVQATIDSSFAATTNQSYKTAAAYKVNDFGLGINGSLIGTDTSGTIPTPNKLSLGTNYSGTAFAAQNVLNGHIAKFYYWNTRKPDSFLQSITG